MKRKRLGLVATLGVLALAALGGGVVWALLQVPDFYEEALTAQVEPTARKQAAETLVQQTMKLVDDINHENTWCEEFTQQQINSFLAEDLHEKYSDLMPKQVQDPRVFFSGGSIHVGFRYDDKKYKGIVSVKARPWIPAPNQLAVEIESVRAGLVPIPLEQIMTEIDKRIEAEGWHTRWTQRNGNDVVIVHFESTRKGDPVLESIEVANGTVRVAGRRRTEDSVESASLESPVTEGTELTEGDGPPKKTKREPTRVAEQIAEGLRQLRKN
jgi:hypothetical protein